MTKSLAEQIGNWCRHYSGLLDDECKAGVRYESVRDDSKRGLARYPCFKESNCAQRCASASFLSDEEIKAEIARARDAYVQFQIDLDQGRCPHCKAKMEKLEQVGRSVYAVPCRHRLFQGTVRKERPKASYARGGHSSTIHSSRNHQPHLAMLESREELTVAGLASHVEREKC